MKPNHVSKQKPFSVSFSLVHGFDQVMDRMVMGRNREDGGRVHMAGVQCNLKLTLVAEKDRTGEY